MVAEKPSVEGVVAVPGLSLDTVGEPLLEAADDCGASGENGSIFGNQADAIRRNATEMRWDESGDESVNPGMVWFGFEIYGGQPTGSGD